MGLFNNLFQRKNKNPEDDFVVTITNESVKVEHPKRKTENIRWQDIREIKLINTDAGPFEPDIWLALVGDASGCMIPSGSKGYDDVYEIVSKYEGFNFESVIQSMGCTGNAQFPLWTRK